MKQKVKGASEGKREKTNAGTTHNACFDSPRSSRPTSSRSFNSTSTSEVRATMAPAAKEFYEDQKNLNKLCNFLRSADGPAVREAIMMDKRVYYIKGKLNYL